jgi:tetratricopeptide (TPR) repeat protein
MLIIKNPAQMIRCARMGRLRGFLFGCFLAVLITGCTQPPGVRALLKGERLVGKGHYKEAIEPLRTATGILSTNATAWNYLGLAYHHTGRTEEAKNAYAKALMLDRDLAEAQYNLGELFFAQGRLDLARNHFLVFVSLRPNSAPGLLRLSAVQLRLRDLAGAEKSASDALRYNPQNPDALTALGLVQVYRGRAAEAIRSFDRALQSNPNHGPALLNSAIVLQQQLQDRPAALRRYKQYLGLKPTPSNAAAVQALIRDLEREPARAQPQPPPAASIANPSPPVATATNLSPPRMTATNSNLVAVAPLTQPPKPRIETNQSTAPPPPSRKTVTPSQQPAAPIEVVRLREEPEIKPAIDQPAPRTVSSPTSLTNPPSDSQEASAPLLAKRPQPAPKRTLLSRLNPLNLLGRDAEKKVPTPKMIATVDDGISQSPVATNNAAPTPPRKYARYKYLSPRKPSPGSRAEAQPLFLSAHTAQQDGRVADAVSGYREALKNDPTLFEAEYNLGIALEGIGDFKGALATYERALALRPDSPDARYNLALALKQENYPVDAAKELERMLKANPQETRAHLALANLYAQELANKSKARQHYLRVLELDPHHPQAGVIQYWLADSSR